MKQTIVAVASSALLACGVANADVGFGAKGGTLGYGAEVTVPMSPKFNGRLGFNTGTVSATKSESGIDYNADLKMQNAAAILDFHPFEGIFRLSVGYVFNGNEIDMEAKPTSGVDTYTVDGQTYTLNSLNGKLTVTNGAFVGMGWGNAGSGRGFGMNLEIGAVYQGSPKFKLTATGNSAVVDDPVFQGHLANEQADAEKAMEDYQWYPAIALGLSYTF